jgi:CDGSH-type Zn-finger protein
MLEKVQIQAMKNGPLLIEGKAEITDENGDVNETKGKMVALCRCGQSANKPFCDGSHQKVGFLVNKTLISF